AWKRQRRPAARRPGMPPAPRRPTRRTDASVPFPVVVELREPVAPNEVALLKPCTASAQTTRLAAAEGDHPPVESRAQPGLTRSGPSPASFSPRGHRVWL